METRFKRALYDFLIQDDISLETNVINELVHRMIGVKFAKEQEAVNHRFGFEFSRHYHQFEDKENKHINFSLPKLSLVQLQQYLDFFKIPEKDYLTNSFLLLNEEYIFDIFLPKFKAFYNHLKATNPLEFSKYKIESKPILEASAIKTLREYTKKAIETILPDETLEASDDAKLLIDELLMLEIKVGKLDDKPLFYKEILQNCQKIENFLYHPLVTANKTLEKQLNLLIEAIVVFKRYHRYESVVANKIFFKEKDAFLTEKKISSKACDVVEETILNLANVKLGAAGECEFDIGYDKSRLVFTFTDMDKANAEKLVNYFRMLGDETATEGHGFKSHGSVIPESCESARMCFSVREKSSPRIVLESHSIEVDGLFFYKHVFPSLKHEITAMEINGSPIFEKYRKLSEKYFEKVTPDSSMINIKSSLFQPKFVCGTEENLENVKSKTLN